MGNIVDIDETCLRTVREAHFELPKGPRNVDNIELRQIETSRVEGKDLRPLTEDKAKTLVLKHFPTHFDWNKRLTVTLLPSSNTQPKQTLFFAMIIEKREASWRSSQGITREFDTVFHALDKWSAPTPAMILDSSSLQKAAEFEWTETQGNGDKPITVHCMCWQHSSECQSCKGIASIDVCFVCRGKGVFKHERCRMCSSNGKYFCKVCTNTGKVSCLTCGSKEDANLLNMTAILRTERKTILTAQIPYKETTDITTEAWKAVSTLENDSSLIAISAIVVRWEPTSIILSDGGKTESYEIIGTDCTHIEKGRRPAFAKHASSFSRSFNSRLGRMGLTTFQ